MHRYTTHRFSVVSLFISDQNWQPTFFHYDGVLIQKFLNAKNDFQKPPISRRGGPDAKIKKRLGGIDLSSRKYQRFSDTQLRMAGPTANHAHTTRLLMPQYIHLAVWQKCSAPLRKNDLITLSILVHFFYSIVFFT